MVCLGSTVGQALLASWAPQVAKRDQGCKVGYGVQQQEQHTYATPGWL